MTPDALMKLTRTEHLSPTDIWATRAPFTIDDAIAINKQLPKTEGDSIDGGAIIQLLIDRLAERNSGFISLLERLAQVEGERDRALDALEPFAKLGKEIRTKCHTVDERMERAEKHRYLWPDLRIAAESYYHSRPTTNPQGD